ncbi:MFS transporter [Desulfofundulus thermobenzoicus]|uniref:MFS transporter n=1 Tax=Desulfofundulus thermobenzoicus TaxID=29376 RepID=A0A6N7IPV9_9FIRM|nr:MFS transporter [Desulfofundulus thermobenzoicus]MQL51609.1 MFS transporter [Desulfofundulus thermobenzoicus]
MKPSSRKSRALKFVLLIGVMSFFADFTYEASRGIIGPYLALLGASAFTVAFVTGFGELLGYAWRLVSGGLADRTGKFWPITIFGYVIQMASVPLLALAGSWQMAAVLIILERFGRATRNPPRDVMLSHAAREMGYGWAFGVHEALDQFGALFGPLAAAVVLAFRGDYRLAFAVLLIPALVMLSLLAVARLTYPHPEDLESTPPNIEAKGLPRVFWLYLAGAVLVAAGFADFPVMAYHFEKTSIVSPSMIPVFYAVAMGVSGAGSLLFGRLFDRFGIIILVPLTILSALFAPLVFLGGFWAALVGIALWGLGMGVHESIIPAAVALMVPVQRRASAYGLFTAGYGIFWFLGSALIGYLYSVSLPLLIAFSLVAESVAIPLFFLVRRQTQSKVSV